MSIAQLREQIEIISAQITALTIAADRGRALRNVARRPPEQAGYRSFEGLEIHVEIARLEIERIKLEAAEGILVAACAKRDHEPVQKNGEWICGNCDAPCPGIGEAPPVGAVV